MNLLPETARIARELQEMFKCLKCKCLPTEPYFTGICDHLLCLDCLSKSNTCPICNAQFYKKESHLNRMVKEAILYVSDIIDLTDSNPKNKETKKNSEQFDTDDSLPEISFFEDIRPKINTNMFKAPLPVTIMPPPPPLKTVTNIDKPEKTKPTKRVSKAQKIRSQSVNIKVDKLEESQRSPCAIPRSQSFKRVKKNNKGETPVHLAVMKDDLESLRELLQDENLDINFKDNAGWTALHEACNKGNLEIVKLLLDHNADINSLGYQKNTPLHEAVINQNYECVKYLIEQNAEQTIRNEYGILARDIAKKNKDHDYIALFSNTQPETISVSSQRCEFLDSDLSSQTQLDLNTSCVANKENRRNNKKNAQKKVVLFGTGMNEADKAKLSSLASKLNLQVAKELKNNVTHIIFSTGSLCTRTISYMKAVLMGIWIVSIKWLEDSIEKGGLEQESGYEAEGSLKIPTSKGPFKGRFNASCQYPKLFEDCYFFLSGEFKVFEKQDFVKLLELGGATILKREPKLERLDELIPVELPYHLSTKTDTEFTCSHFILYDTSKVKEIRHQYLNTVRPSWLFSSIDEFQILKP